MNHRLATVLVGTGILVLVAGCATPASPPSASPSGSPSVVPPVLPSDPPPTSAPSPSSEPEPVASNRDIDPATFLQICAARPDDIDGDPIWCDDLVRTALEGLADGKALVRVETTYSCATSCRPVEADRGYVLVFSPSGAVEVEVERQSDGVLGVAATTPFDPPGMPAFDAPPVDAPAIDGAPESINGRAPLPLCGVESGSAYGPFDTAARQCFWDGVRAGSPVEFIATQPDTEGRSTTTIHRYAGAGAVEIFMSQEEGWTRMVSGIAPTGDDRVFDFAGLTRTDVIAEP